MGRDPLSERSPGEKFLPDRRRWLRERPSYTKEETAALQITHVHIHRSCLFCRLSDDNLLCVPFAISPTLALAPVWAQYQWRVQEGGRALVWKAGFLVKYLPLSMLLANPHAQISPPGEVSRT